MPLSLRQFTSNISTAVCEKQRATYGRLRETWEMSNLDSTVQVQSSIKCFETKRAGLCLDAVCIVHAKPNDSDVVAKAYDGQQLMQAQGQNDIYSEAMSS
jgi:hypothetical protein